MIEKLEKITQVEETINQRRSTSKSRYPEVLEDYREKANHDIQILEVELQKKRDELLEEAHNQALEINEKSALKTQKEIEALEARFELKKEAVRKQLIQEVFENGNR